MTDDKAADAERSCRVVIADDSTADANPSRKAPPSVLSRRLVLWIWQLVWLGEKRPLEPEDLPNLAEHLETAHLSDVASRLWDLELARAGTKASLASVLWHILRGTTLMWFVASILNGVLAAGIRPAMLRQVINTVEDLALQDVLVLSAVLCSEAMLQLWMKQLGGDEPALTVMSTCTALVSKRIPAVSELSASEGKSIAEAQLVSNDVVRALENILKLFHSVSAIMQIICSITVLLIFIGYPALIGIGLSVVIVALSVQMSKLNKRNDIRQLEAADRRLAMLRQILDGVRFIKSNAWEESYMQELTRQRAEESVHNRKYRTIEMLGASFGRVTPPLASMLTFVTMSLLGRPMLPADIFTAVSIFMTLRLPLGILPECCMQLQALLVSCRRVGSCLQKPTAGALQPPKDQALAAAFTDADFTWSKEPVLRGLSLSFPWGTSAAVIGAVGSGKSTLLLGLLGGLPASRGSVSRCRGAVAYVPQRPVVFSGSVLSNVLMGHTLDQARLDSALEAAQFKRDLELMPAGLETEIGERGTTLSGGQQTRLNIARAFYHQPQLMIADDPLAAVDVHVGLAIFHSFVAWKCAAPEKRALIMAINQLAWLSSFEQVVYLEGGAVVARGSPKEVRQAAAKHRHLSDLLESARVAVTCDDVPVAVDDIKLLPKGGAASKEERQPTRVWTQPSFGGWQTLLRVLCLGCFPPWLPPSSTHKTSVAESMVAHHPTGTFGLTTEEHRERGRMKSSVLMQYLIAIGPFWGSTYLTCIVAALEAVKRPEPVVVPDPDRLRCLQAYGLLVANDVWLARWVRQGPDGSRVDELIYGLLACSHSLMMIVCNVASGFAGARAGRNLHYACLSHTLHAPLAYFDATPSGRIISRFSADMAVVDLRLPTWFDQSVQIFAVTCVLFGTISVVLPWMLLFFVVVGPLYYRLDMLVNRSSCESKRITNNALSPILTLVQEAASSRLLLRVMEREAWLHDATVEHVSLYARAYYTSNSLMSFLRMQGNILGVIMTSLFVLLLWAMPALVKSVPGGATMVGLALTYSVVVPYMLSFLSLFTSFVRVFLASLERLLEQTSTRVPQELPWHTADDPPSDWPSRGRLELCGATLCYRPNLPPAIDRLTLEVPPATWLGVVGRSGAGKSSLVAMLLRLVELSDGAIFIDGVDTAKVGLHALRQAMALVPQDPFLVQGPLSKNMDPFGWHSEAAQVEALSCVGLDLPLDTSVGKGGSQLSAGQRQLVAMARATLSRARIVLLDEPTANCDARTDALLQEVTRRAFSGRTVLCVAHRLNTILSYDAVLVMEAGRAVEHGPTARLAADSSSRFAQMVSASSRSGASA